MNNNFKWDESHKADREGLLDGVIPTMSEVIHAIDISGATKEEKSLLYTMMLTSCRISEACAVKCEDIRIYLKHNIELNYDNSKNYSINPVTTNPFNIEDVEKVIFHLDNLKRKEHSRKSIPALNIEVNTIPLNHILQHMRKLDNPQAQLYTCGRKNGWWIFKRYPGINKVLPFSHATRHISLSNHVKKDIDVATIKEIAGWTNLSPYSHYIHLNTSHVEKKLREAYADEPIEAPRLALTKKIVPQVKKVQKKVLPVPQIMIKKKKDAEKGILQVV